MVKCLIEFDFKFNHIILLANIIFNFLLYKGEKNIYSFYIGNLIGCIISFIFYLIKNKNQKIMVEERFFSEKKNELDGPVKSNLKQFIDFFIVFLIFFIFNGSIFLIQYLSKRIFYACHNFMIISMVFFYHFIMKKNLYVHHFICLIFIIFFTRFHPFFKPRIIYGEKLISIIFYLLNGIEQYSLKYMMEKYYINPFIISFFDCLSQLILELTKTFVHNKKNGDVFFNKSYYNINSYLNSIIFIIGLIITPIFNCIILYYFTPFHYYITEEIGVLNDFNLQYFIYVFGIISSLLVFIEVIILNFCGLSTNTNKKISERAKKEDISKLQLSYLEKY